MLQENVHVSIELIGWLAVILTQVFWVPNIARIVRTRDVDGHSLPAWLIMFAGLLCWLVYFTARGDVVGMVANISGVTGAGITTACVWLWGRRKPKLTVTEVAAPPFAENLTPEQG